MLKLTRNCLFVLAVCVAVAFAFGQGNIKVVAESEFDATVNQAGLPVVVDLYADWCGPCRMLAPIMDRLANEFSGKIQFVKVNVDQAPGLSKRYNVRGIPTILFFDKGKLVDTSVGLPQEQALRSRLQALAAKPAQ